MLTETEALELLKKASRATSSIPRDEGLKVADDCGFLPLAIAIIGAMGISRVNPHSPETWRGVHARLVEEPTLVQDRVGGALTVSFCELNDGSRTRFRKLGVLVRGVRAPVDMVAHLWEQDLSDTELFLSDLVDKSLVKVEEQRYYLHDLVLDFAKDELRRLRGKVQLVASRQAQYDCLAPPGYPMEHRNAAQFPLAASFFARFASSFVVDSKSLRSFMTGA
eukprot:g14437.t1